MARSRARKGYSGTPIPTTTLKFYQKTPDFANLMWAAQYPAYKVASDHMGVASLNFWTLLLSLLLIAP